jgi:hypothetical protein
MTTALEKRDTQTAADALVGRTIENVRYMEATEARQFGWYYRPLVLELDDGAVLFATADEEMNDAGVLLVARGAAESFHVLGRHVV